MESAAAGRRLVMRIRSATAGHHRLVIYGKGGMRKWTIAAPRTPAPAAVDLGDLVASYVRILSDVVEHDGHELLRPISVALRNEINHLRAGILAPEPVAVE